MMEAAESSEEVGTLMQEATVVPTYQTIVISFQKTLIFV
jgi:hypothetical protein